MKVRDLVQASARIIGIIASGENMTDAEMSDAVSALNMLLGQWSASRDYVYSVSTIYLTVYADSPIYQVQAKLLSDEAKLNGEDIRIYRDISLNIPPNSIIYERTVAIAAAPIPMAFNFIELPSTVDGLYILYLPNGTSGELELKSLNSPQFPLKALDDIVVLPEYLRAIKYALAIELAPEYQLPVTPDIQQQYQQSIRIMHRSQSTPTSAKPDQVLMGISRGRHWGHYD